MLQELITRMSGRREKQTAEQANDVRALVLALAKAELGIADDDDGFDLDYGAKLLEAAGWTEAELRANVETYKQRFRLAEQAARLGATQAAAESAERAFQENCDQLRRLQEQRPALVNALTLAKREYETSLRAQSDLQASATESNEERQLVSQLAELSQRIDHANGLLNRFGGVTSHVAMANQIREELRRVKPTMPRHAELEKRLAYHERETANRQKELAKLTKERDAIHAKLKKLSASKLQPENFALVRQPQPTQPAAAVR